MPPGFLPHRTTQNPTGLSAKRKCGGRQLLDLRALAFLLDQTPVCRAPYPCLMTPEARWQAFCWIKPERLMSATVSPPLVQAAFGSGNRTSARRLAIQWLATQGLPGRAATEDIEMFARNGVFSLISRAAVMATVAAVALTAFEPSLALAGSAPSGKGLSAATATSGAQDFSARRRSFRGGGGAAAVGAFAAIVGTGLAIAATRDRDDYYYGGGPAYYGGPGYYDGGAGYYGGSPLYYGGGGY